MNIFKGRLSRKLLATGTGVALAGSLFAGVGANAGGAVTPKASLPTVTLTYGAAAECWLPVWVAIVDGTFTKAGLNVQSTVHQGASSLVIPLLATGQFDFGTVTPGAPLSNAPGQGYDVKLIFGTDEPHTGYLSAEWISVANRVIPKSGFSLKTLKNNPNLVVSTTNAQGSPGDVETVTMFRDAGLSLSQVKTYQVNSAVVTQAQNIQLFANGTIDVGGLVGPADDVAQNNKIAREWLQYSNIIPWYQDCLVAVNGPFLAQNPTLVVKFVKGLLMADQIIAKAEAKSPRFTPGLAGVAASVTGFTVGEVFLGRLPYIGGYGQIIGQSLVNIQNFTQSEGIVPKPLPINQIVPTLVDVKPLNTARKQLGLTGAPPALLAKVPNQKPSFPVLKP